MPNVGAERPSTPGHGFGRTDALLLFSIVVWGINYSAIKYASQVMSPVSFIWLRVSIAALTLLTFAFIGRHPWPRRRDVLGLLALGSMGNGIYQLLFVEGVARTRVADAALLAATSPMLVALISQAIGMERMRPRALLGITLSIAGVAVVVFGSAHHTHGEGSWLGIGLVLAAVACWSIFTVLVRPYTLRVDMVQLNSLTMMGGMIPLLFVTPAAITGTAWSSLSLVAWLVVAYSSVLSMGIVYIFWFGGVRVLGPTRTSVYANLQPVVAILFAWAVLHEAPTFWQGLGAATIITGIVLSRR
jgi:drug/metabolite transporter (DMT)-like permease